MQLKRTMLIVAIAILATACQLIVIEDSAVTPPRSVPPVSTIPPSTATTSLTAVTSTAHEPIWVTVRYRTDPVDLAYPGRFDLMVPDSTLVAAAAFDQSNRYLLISLNGVWYHYCGVTGSVWSAFGAAPSKGRFYTSDLQGRYDCREGDIPAYE